MNLKKIYEKHSTSSYKDKNDKKISNSISQVVTLSGIYEKDKWILLVNKKLDEKQECQIFKMLIDYALNNCAWITETEEAEKYALSLYSSRIWEDPVWVGYKEFNRELNKLTTIGQLSFI